MKNIFLRHWCVLWCPKQQSSHDHHVQCVHFVYNYSDLSQPDPTVKLQFFSDINECAEGTHQCAHACHNTNGSYTCSCRAGYALNSDGRDCDGTLVTSIAIENHWFVWCSLDINECVLGTDMCAQICNNTIGSYTCQCRIGFTLNSDGRGCGGEPW